MAMVVQESAGNAVNMKGNVVPRRGERENEIIEKTELVPEYSPLHSTWGSN